MIDELVDIVDENDGVIGQELKSKCHAQKILHRAANILCFKDKNENRLLISKRSIIKDADPGKLCTPGGHLMAGETYLQGAKREFFEEINNNQEIPLEFIELFKIKKSADNDFEYVTTFKVIHAGPFSPDTKEVEYCYFEDIKKIAEELKNQPEKFTGTTKVILEKYLADKQ